MKLKIKDLKITSGGFLVFVLNCQDAQRRGIHAGDRVLIVKGNHRIIGIANISYNARLVPQNTLGIYHEVANFLHAKNGTLVTLMLAPQAESIEYIKKKLDGEALSKKEMNAIVADIVSNNLSAVELTYFVAACYNHRLDMKGTAMLTKAMTTTGEVLHLHKKIIVDKHCIGGLCGNRTTPIIVAILAAGGLTVPKTSSRSITSPAGTADTVEVFCPVTLTISQMKKVIAKTGACLVWGGAVNLAPADDRIIKVEKPLSIDAESQLLASILAKKASVGATHVLIDIPVGKTAKVQTTKAAQNLSRDFMILGRRLGMHITTYISDGKEPIGNGIGPALEARDVLRVLSNDSQAPRDLREKSLQMAGKIFDFVESTASAGYQKAAELLESGAALEKFFQIIIAQGGKHLLAREIPLGRFSYLVAAQHAGNVREIDNALLSRICRVAGAPDDKGAGVYLSKHIGERIRKREVLYTIYAENAQKLAFVKQLPLLSVYSVSR